MRQSLNRNIRITINCNLSWPGDVVSVVKRLSYYIIRTETLSVPMSLVNCFIFTCIIPHCLYSSSVTFPGVFNKNKIKTRISFKQLSYANGLTLETSRILIGCYHQKKCAKISRVEFLTTFAALFPLWQLATDTT